MNKIIRTLTLCTLLGSGVAMAQGSSAGQFDIAALSGDLSPKVNINFGTAMMSGFAESMSESNPDLSDILRGVSGLRLMVFEDVDTSGVEPGIQDAIAQLNRDGWSQAMKIESDDTFIDLFMIESAEFVEGMVLLLRDDDDTLVLANMHGELNAAAVGRLLASGKAFDGWNIDFSGQDASITIDD